MMLSLIIEVTEKEAELLYLVMERATDQADFRESWKSDDLKRLEAKVKASVVLAQQKEGK